MFAHLTLSSVTHYLMVGHIVDQALLMTVILPAPTKTRNVEMWISDIHIWIFHGVFLLR
jgi:hypothetical protein